MAKLLGGTRIYGTGTIDTSLAINGTSSATSTASGSLTVAGGVGIGGNLYVGSLRGDTTAAATTWGLFYNATTKEITTATSGSGGTGGISSTGTTSTFIISSTATSTSTNSGALQVVGGVGIGGSLFVGSIGTFSNIAGTISTTTGALQVRGGVGIGGGLYLGGVATATTYIANGSLAGSTNIGAFTYGTLSYSDSYNLAALQSNNNGYIQLVVQNTNAGTAASGDIVISNNLGTLNTYYGNLGMNSSAFTGVGSFNLPNAVYLASSQGDLVLGSFSLNSIRFALNSAAVDAITISTVSNSVIINNTATITATTASVSTNTGALTVAGGVGIGGGVYIGGSLTATSINTVGAGGGVISGITQLGVGNFTATGIVSISGSISSIVTSTNTASSVSTTTGALIVAGGVGIGGNLNVGGVITATSLVTTGAGLGVMTGLASISTVNLTASGSITATNIYTVGSGVSTIVGLGLISTIASTVTGLLSVTSSTAATSTTTGAVRVTGGVGVGGDVYVGGNVYLPNRPAFRVIGNGGNISNGATLTATNWVMDYQQGTALNTSTGIFTAPVAGLYQVNLVMRVWSNTSATISQAIVYKNATVATMLEFGTTSTMNHAGVSTVAKLAIGDTLKTVVAVGTLSFDSNDNWSVAFIG